MSPVVLPAILITLALVFSSIGVWSERLARFLKPRHVAAFWTGFLFDVCGTTAMHNIAKRPFNLSDPHTLTGQIAIWLMLAHAVWATVVIRKGTDSSRKGFHRYSLVVWLVWLVPYLGGLILAMSR